MVIISVSVLDKGKNDTEFSICMCVFPRILSTIFKCLDVNFKSFKSNGIQAIKNLEKRV